MLELIEKHLADLSAGKWNDYKAALAANVVYEEAATRVRVKGADEYVKVIQRWKKAFPDITAKLLRSFEAKNTVIVEVEWSGTQNGPLEGPFGTIAPTGKFGTVTAALVFELENDKIVACRHYFDLMTILVQAGVMPQLKLPPLGERAITPPAQRH